MCLCGWISALRACVSSCLYQMRHVCPLMFIQVCVNVYLNSIRSVLSIHFSVYRKQETLQIQEAEAFSSKRCLEWFYEYAGMCAKSC